MAGNRQHIIHGLRDGIPIAMGYFAVKFSLGISVAHPGYTPPAYTYSAALISTLFWASGCAVGIMAGSPQECDVPKEMIAPIVSNMLLSL